MICGHGTRDGRLCKRWCGDHGRCPHHGEALGSIFDELAGSLREIGYSDFEARVEAFDGAMIKARFTP